MKLTILAAALALAATAPGSPARPAGALDRVRAEGVLHCGAEERPGFAAVSAMGASGVAVDLCRAVAVAILGPEARSRIRLYDSDRAFDALRHGDDELAFLSGSAIMEHRLGAALLPGPTVFIDGIGVMVPQDSPVHAMADLDGRTVCLMIGGAGQRALEAAADRLHLRIGRIGFQEDVEMLDAYNVQHCQAAVGETTYLAAMRQSSGVNHLSSRLLPPLLLEPLIAATSVQDGAWSALIYWIINGVMRSGRMASGWDADAVPVDPALLGLRGDWQSVMAEQVGSYADIIRRNLGQGLRLDAGPNALWPEGMFVPPTR
ncbi:MAG: hypothetical protein ACJ8AW_25115 [Rhodopila sp.]